MPKLLTHRGVTHSLLFALVLFPVYKGLTLGCLIHLFLDMCNPAGVPLAWPIRRKKELIKTKIPIISAMAPSGGFLDKLLGVVLWLVAAALFWTVITGIPLLWSD